MRPPLAAGSRSEKNDNESEMKIFPCSSSFAARSPSMASTGHFGWQAPQSMHSFALM
ncbi:hypothetical protein FB388_4165 [Pseudonocardia cypriaca]|uniref:Uncharacterized protein n=1 Tax=Pseudonocardia cypriaca TaxID=882449 RepID=A0A543FT08_9PSEU|nr:hypothetical protein FB388_4165 [Pseudonocardia cypriaca]